VAEGQGRGNWSWPKARDRYYAALTLKDKRKYLGYVDDLVELLKITGIIA